MNGHTCIYHAPAELIDVSFSDPQDRKVQTLKDKNIKDWTRLFDLGDGVKVRNGETLLSSVLF